MSVNAYCCAMAPAQPDPQSAKYDLRVRSYNRLVAISKNVLVDSKAEMSLLSIIPTKGTVAAIHGLATQVEQ